ncbi:hypothetical protein FEM48_Zijuj05G0160000 [Ziziphus jujuba var. spinosa]|uniref:Protein kinase domain-containing protein n=1 Tax=Ziziphus jujuba var. spinosa TaxID=714518 RepID=A0A978VFR7_ZIZJJ|nr:hypothetical protein FEM48_Zijuj05G0160000 [Ziziphus jujuba var. spinosa]
METAAPSTKSATKPRRNSTLSNSFTTTPTTLPYDTISYKRSTSSVVPTLLSVVCCHAVFGKPLGDVSFLMEYMDWCSLETQLKTRGALSESKNADVASNVTKGLHYLHSKKIVHRDIKPANLLMNSRMEVKIADVGVSKTVGPTMEYTVCNSFVGTCAYLSPERFERDRYGYAGDIWSLGVTLMQLYMGHFPLLPAGKKPDWATLMCAVCFGELPGLPENVSHEFRSCCLQRDSSKIWTASQLLTHHFLCQHPISDS